jgi:hypothetical protein
MRLDTITPAIRGEEKGPLTKQERDRIIESGINRRGKKMFMTTEADTARGQALDQRVRAQLLGF